MMSVMVILAKGGLTSWASLTTMVDPSTWKSCIAHLEKNTRVPPCVFILPSNIICISFTSFGVCDTITKDCCYHMTCTCLDKWTRSEVPLRDTWIAFSNQFLLLTLCFACSVSLKTCNGNSREALLLFSEAQKNWTASAKTPSAAPLWQS